MRQFSLLILAWLICGHAFSQDPYFERDLFINDAVDDASLVVSASGFMYVSADDRLIKTDRDGNVVWNKVVPPATNRQYYINTVRMIGDSVIVIVKLQQVSLTDTNGNILWNYSFPEDYLIHQTVIIGGRIHVFGTNEFYFFFAAKLDQNGNLLYKTIFENDPKLAAFLDINDIKVLKDSSILIGGTADSYLNIDSHTGDPFLIKFNPEGDSIWCQRYRSYDFRTALHIETDHDGNIYYIGNWTSSSFSGDHNGLMVKTDSEGNMLWVKEAGIFEKVQAFVLQNDTSFALICANDPDVADSLFLVKTDTSGNILSLGPLIHSTNGLNFGCYDVKKTDGEGFILLGRKFILKENGTRRTNSIFIRKFDREWNPVITHDLPVKLETNHRFCSRNDTLVLKIKFPHNLPELPDITLELSDNHGDFSDATNILTLDDPDSTTWHIPYSTILDNPAFTNKSVLYGHHYLRVVSSNPDIPFQPSRPIFVLFSRTPDYSLIDYDASIYNSEDIVHTPEVYCIDDRFYMMLKKEAGYEASGEEHIEWHRGNFHYNVEIHQDGESEYVYECTHAGDFPFSVRISNRECITNLYDTIVVRNSPQINLVFKPDTFCHDHAVIYATGEIENREYNWDFNDAVVDSGTGLGPYHVHWTWVDYNQKLIRFSVSPDSAGCGVELYQTYYVPLPEQIRIDFISFNRNNQPVLYWDQFPETPDTFYIIKTNGQQEVPLCSGRTETYHTLYTTDSLYNYWNFTDTTAIDSSMSYTIYTMDGCGLKSYRSYYAPSYLYYKIEGDSVRLSWTKYRDPWYIVQEYELFKGRKRGNLSSYYYTGNSTAQNLQYTVLHESDTTYYQVVSNADNITVFNNSNMVMVPGTNTGIPVHRRSPAGYVATLGNGRYAVHIDDPEADFDRLELVNVLGVVVAGKKIEPGRDTRLDLSSYHPGVYLVVLEGGNAAKSVLRFVHR